ncbi:MAG: glycosyl hydrolase family 28 protein [Clostridia bacterium]|jgi:polygalacturonase|nr:glycosyl hydrolase family 28 protein [Clostridia bacterium]
MDKLTRKRIKKYLGMLIPVILIFSLGIVALEFYLPYSGKQGSPITTTYHMAENGKFLTDIPFDDYLHEAPAIQGVVFDIRDYGAGTELSFLDNTLAVQNTINAAFDSGGGTVLVDGGTYRTSTLGLKSNVTLRINEGACLECITYDENKSLSEENRLDVLGYISAKDADNVKIEGPGRIAGNGATYVKPAKEDSEFLPLDTFNLKRYIVEHRKRIMMGKEHEFKRAMLLGMNNCTNVTIQNLELYEAGSWTARLEGVENLHIEDVVINNNVRVANTDGFDIEGGKNIVIRHCFIATGDDAICIKTDNADTPALDGMIVEDCEIMSLANCFKIGTATWNTISNVIVRDCFFFMPGIAGGYSGIAIECVDGSTVSDITIENIVMEHVTSPFVIWLGYRNGEGTLKNITISDITATGCDVPSAITGYKKGSKINYVQNVKINNVRVAYREAQEKLNIFNNSKGAYEGILNMAGYPEITRVSHMSLISSDIYTYWDLPVYGLFARYVDGLEVQNFVVTPRSENIREMNNVEEEKDRIDIKNVSWTYYDLPD